VVWALRPGEVWRLGALLFLILFAGRGGRGCTPSRQRTAGEPRDLGRSTVGCVGLPPQGRFMIYWRVFIL
jgi:hypothetical protein